MSETMGTLHGLVDKGVKVELGIPLEMWDEPSAAVTKMKQYVSKIVFIDEPFYLVDLIMMS